MKVKINRSKINVTKKKVDKWKNERSNNVPAQSKQRRKRTN